MSLPDPPPPPEPRLVTAGVHQVAVEESATPDAPPPPVETGRQYSFRHIETGELTQGTVTCSKRHLAANTPLGHEAVDSVVESNAPVRPEMESDIHRRIDELETRRRLANRSRSEQKVAALSALDDQIAAELDKLEARRLLKAQLREPTS